MLDITSFGLFAFSVFLLSVTPGPDMAYVIGQSVANGRRAGIVSASGVTLGSCTHAIASTLGLTALITASPVMFTAIKYIGASYLIFLGGKCCQEHLIQNRTGEILHFKKSGKIYNFINDILAFYKPIGDPRPAAAPDHLRPPGLNRES